MMGTKIRNFVPLPDLSLEELVPKDNFYRRLEETLDLSFVRNLVEERYAPSGRPSVDPVVFFKLQLVLFFEGLRSERQLMAVVAERSSVRKNSKSKKGNSGGSSVRHVSLSTSSMPLSCSTRITPRPSSTRVAFKKHCTRPPLLNETHNTTSRLIGAAYAASRPSASDRRTV